MTKNKAGIEILQQYLKPNLPANNYSTLSFSHK